MLLPLVTYRRAYANNITVRWSSRNDLYCLVLSCAVLSGLVWHCRVMSYRSLTCLILPIGHCPVPWFRKPWMPIGSWNLCSVDGPKKKSLQYHFPDRRLSLRSDMLSSINSRWLAFDSWIIRFNATACQMFLMASTVRVHANTQTLVGIRADGT